MEEHSGGGGATDPTSDQKMNSTEHVSPSAVDANDFSSWRLDINNFRLPESSAADRQSFALRRLLLPTPRTQRKVKAYYKKQETLVEGFNEMETISKTGSLPGALTEDEMTNLAESERMAIYVSNVVNLILFIAKVYASLESRSLAVIASTLDSFLDLLSGFILWFTSNAMRNPNRYKYPIGKNRMQPVGIIVFASVMATLGFQILLESARELLAHVHPNKNQDNEHWVIGIMVSVTVVKFCLMVYCRRFENAIVRAYAQDHFFDVITNSIGLAATILAVHYKWWIDPVGAIIVISNALNVVDSETSGWFHQEVIKQSLKAKGYLTTSRWNHSEITSELIALYTINTWTKTVIENVWSLIGRTAPPEFLAKLTYLVWNHHEEIKHIDTVRAYTFGSHYFVEVDIVLPEDMMLIEAHNIGEMLQDKLEQLSEVERAFVHVDFEFTHTPEHKEKV